MKNKQTYTLYLFYEDTYLAKYKVRSDDWKNIYKEYSEKTIILGMKIGWKLKDQNKKCKWFITDYEKRVRHCERTKKSDLMLLLSTFFIRYKMNDTKCDFIFLKNKIKPKKKNLK
tara:strand:+ start:4839 stop:5183 length:345 start_codon:yes stop_codon:yes gene_type:complete